MNNFDKIYNVAIDIRNSKSTYYTNASFYEDDRKTAVMQVKVLNDNKQVNLAECNIDALFLLPNNEGHTYSCSDIDLESGTVRIELPTEVLKVGINSFALSISKGEEIANTPLVTYEVRKGISKDITPSTPNLPTLQQLILDVRVVKIEQDELYEKFEEKFNYVSNIQEDYDSLRKVIIDENVSASLKNEIKEIEDKITVLNSELDSTNLQIETKASLEQIGHSVVEKTNNNYNSDDIENAFSSAISKGEKNIYLKNGTYEITRPITILNGFKVYGNSKTIIHDYTNDYAIKVHGGDEFMVAPIVYSQVENLEIVNKSNSKGAISINNAYLCNFKNIKIINSCYENAELIKIVDFFNISFEDIHILNATTSDGFVCDAIKGNSGQLNFHNCLVQKVKNGFVLNGSGNATDGVDISSCGIGSNSESCIKLLNNIKGVNIKSSHLEHMNGSTNGDSAIITSANSNTIDSVVVLGNRFVNCKYPITGGNSSRVFIQSNQFDCYNIPNSVAIRQASTDVRWNIGINQFVDCSTTISENGQYHYNIDSISTDLKGQLFLGKDKVGLYYGTGYPENVVVAKKGSIYFRTDGNVGTYIYIKNIDGGSKGWIAFGYQHIVVTNSSRPVANTLPSGSVVFNSETNKLNISNGTSWYDALGNLVSAT